MKQYYVKDLKADDSHHLEDRFLVRNADIRDGNNNKKHLYMTLADATGEIQAVKWAIDRMTPEEFEDMQEAFELMEFYTMKQDPTKMLAMNTRFHQIIYNGTKNRMLQHVLTSYQVYTKNTKVSPEYIKEYMDEVLAEHRQIFLAFQTKDKEAASRAAVQHMQNGKHRAGFGTD